MADAEWLPPDLYHSLEEEGPASPNRPVGLGDVFRGLPRLTGAHTSQPGVWKAKIKAGESELAMMIAHPCSGRTAAYKLKQTLSFAPIKRRPSNWGPPWEGHYDFFPLTGLLEGEDYVVDLSEIFPVR